MKKAFFVGLLLLVVALFSFAQEYVEDMDGFDWIQMSWDQRGGYVQGFYVAYSSISERVVAEAGGWEGMTQDDMDFIDEYFYISINIGDMVQRITDFYSNYNNRKYQIYVVLMTFAGKDYWNAEPIPEEVPSNGGA